ncbi:MAG: VOC family protein [Proteobacteria bacterium]|nr:VOC family protein [Pseudomonadota bacterium]
MAVAESISGGCFATRRLGHVNLFISDYERSLWFYREVAGLCDGWTRPAIGGGFLNNGFTHHDIGYIPWNVSAAGAGVDKPGLNHLAFEVDSEADLVAGYERGRAAGITFPRTVDHLVAYSIYSRDPHGFGIEIYADTTLSFSDPGFNELRRASEPWVPGEKPPSARRNYPQDPQPRVDKAAIFHARHLAGAVLVSADFDAAVDYYTGVVGLNEIGSGPAYARLGGYDGSPALTLFRADAANGLTPGFHHMSFAVFDEADLTASIAAAKTAGITIEQEIDHPTRRGAVVTDPDGFKVLFHVDRSADRPDVGGLSPAETIWLV